MGLKDSYFPSINLVVSLYKIYEFWHVRVIASIYPIVNRNPNCWVGLVDSTNKQQADMFVKPQVISTYLILVSSSLMSTLHLTKLVGNGRIPKLLYSPTSGRYILSREVGFPWPGRPERKSYHRTLKWAKAKDQEQCEETMPT